MMLFTKDIDKKLFQQYDMGSNLEKQKVIAKIFNPYGNGRWFLINSDPNDPNYLWAIVQMGDTVEVGSVSRQDLISARVGRFRFPLERDLGFSPVNAAELFRGLNQGKFYADGGETEVEEEQTVTRGFYEDEPYEYAKGGDVKWQDAIIGDSARVKSENKMGVIKKDYGRKFHLKFVDGTEKTYDASELEFIKDEDDYADGGYMANGGYVNQYFGKGYENDAIIELKKALPNHKFEKGNNEIIVDNGKFIIDLRGKYGFIRSYSNEGSEGGISVQKLDEAISFIESNKMENGGYMAKGGGIAEVGVRYYVGQPEVSPSGRFGRKRYSWKVITFDKEGNKREGQDNYASTGSAKNHEINGIRISQKDFDKLVFKKKMADGGYMAKGGYVNQYFGKGYENDAIIELKKALPNHKFEKGNNEIIVDNGKFIIDLRGKYGFIRSYSNEGSEGGISVQKLDEAISFIESNKMENGGYMAKGGIVVTSIKDIPNFKQRLDEGKITYRGLGLGKLWDDFNKLTGTTGTRIKVDGKEYFITDEEFNTFSRGADGKMRIKFDAPFRKSYEDGGYMAKGGEVMKHKHIDYLTIQLIEPTSKGWKVKQIETHSIKGNKLSAPKEKIAYFSKDEIKDLFEPTMAKGGGVDDGGYMAEVGDVKSSTEKLISEIKKYSTKKEGIESTASDGSKYRYDKYILNYTSTPNWLVNIFDKAAQENNKKNGTQFHYQDKYSIAFERPKFKGEPNGKIMMTELIELGSMAMGGKVTFDDKVSSIKKSLLKTKKVSPKVQKDYGKTYNKKEALESAQRIAGAMKAKYKK